MDRYIDSEKLIAEIERYKQGSAIARFDNAGENADYFQGKVDLCDDLTHIIASLQQEQLETNMKSPFTGGKVTILSREEEVTFRGEKVKILRKYYRCVDTGREFTDSKLDDDMMWAAFRAYCEKKGMTSFTNIILKQEQPEVDLEKEIDEKWDEFVSSEGERENFTRIARHFYELGLNVRKDQLNNWNDEYREDELQIRFAFYTYKDEDGVLYLSNVFVEETSRNKGFGTKILFAAEKVAETIGANIIRLKVKQDSPANIWYQKNGYGYMISEDGYDWLEKVLNARKEE